ncbi:MAG TPA: PepSY-like domain-containing protein [Chitinophagaceae bacterium]|nr:PepSY-like domain-containing protein [Chitinophagaceae bacterium]
MKVLKPFFLFAILFTFTNLQAQDKTLPVSEAPANIKSFVKAHFPNNKISRIHVDEGFFTIEYEVYLDNKTELEFDKGLFDDKPSLEKIDTEDGIPNSFFQKNIRDYISKKYPNTTVIEWQIDDGEQTLDLSNGLELIFDTKGNFIRRDD